MRLTLVTSVLVFIVSGVVQGQQSNPQKQRRSIAVEVFQVLGLPLNIHEAVLLERESGFVLRCRMSSESASEIRGLRYSLTAIDTVKGAYPLINRIEGFGLTGYGARSLTFVTPIKFRPKDGERLVLMLEQVMSAEAIWEVIKAKDALDAYVKGDYSSQPNVMRVANQVDAPPQNRVIY